MRLRSVMPILAAALAAPAASAFAQGGPPPPPILIPGSNGQEIQFNVTGQPNIGMARAASFHNVGASGRLLFRGGMGKFEGRLTVVRFSPMPNANPKLERPTLRDQGQAGDDIFTRPAAAKQTGSLVQATVQLSGMMTDFAGRSQPVNGLTITVPATITATSPDADKPTPSTDKPAGDKPAAGADKPSTAPASGAGAAPPATPSGFGAQAIRQPGAPPAAGQGFTPAPGYGRSDIPTLTIRVGPGQSDLDGFALQLQAVTISIDSNANAPSIDLKERITEIAKLVAGPQNLGTQSKITTHLNRIVQAIKDPKPIGK